jgi:hypothetical protein
MREKLKSIAFLKKFEIASFAGRWRMARNDIALILSFLLFLILFLSIQNSLLFLEAILISYRATGFASRLAAALAFHTTVLDAVVFVAVVKQNFNSFHIRIISVFLFYLSRIFYIDNYTSYVKKRQGIFG